MSTLGMTFAAAEHAYLVPDDEHECEDDDCSCEQKAQDAYDDAQIERADARRKGDEYA
jgi:hypothetical protein